MKEKRSDWLYILIFCALPIMIMGVLSLWKGFDLSKFTPVYNDEVSWYSQTAAVVKYGGPLGYYGYNGSHAQIGTFGTWGMSIVYFMALIPKLLSFFMEINESVIILGNMVWACLANGLFVLLAKPDRKQLKVLILLYLCLYVNHMYMFFAMAETLRFSIALILAGMFCFLHGRQGHSKYKIMLYVIVPISILLAASTYVVFGVLFSVWFYFVYKDNEKLSRYTAAYFAGTLFLSLCITFMIYIINGYCAGPYMEGTASAIIYAFKKGIVHGIKFTILSILKNFEQCSPWFVISSIGVEHGFISSQLLLYYAMLALAVYAVVKGWKNAFKNAEAHFIIAFVLIAWLAAFVVLYDTSSWTLVRGLNVALVFSLYLLAMTDVKAMKKIMVIALAGLVPFLLTFEETSIHGRNDTGRTNLSKEFGELIVLDEESEDPWENTVAYYGAYQKHGFDLPIGTGVNLMLYGGVNEKAKYAIIEDDHYIDTEKILQELQDHHHEIIFQKEDIVVMKNMGVN